MLWDNNKVDINYWWRALYAVCKLVLSTDTNIHQHNICGLHFCGFMGFIGFLWEKTDSGSSYDAQSCIIISHK